MRKYRDMAQRNDLSSNLYEKKEGKMPRKKAIVKKKGFNLWERVYKGALKFFSKEYPNKPKRKRAKK